MSLNQTIKDGHSSPVTLSEKKPVLSVVEGGLSERFFAALRMTRLKDRSIQRTKLRWPES